MTETTPYNPFEPDDEESVLVESGPVMLDGELSKIIVCGVRGRVITIGGSNDKTNQQERK